MAGGRTGRRPGDSGTREAIAVAARELFAEHGYDRTTMRAIGRRAKVDPALVSYFYGSKPELFQAVVRLPFEPEQVIPALLEGGREGLGERVARFLVTELWEGERAEIEVALVRTAASDPAAAALIREIVMARAVSVIKSQLEIDQAPLRATLVGTQIVGLVMARHVVQVPPLVEADPEDVIALMTPIFQHLLVEPLA